MTQEVTPSQAIERPSLGHILARISRTLDYANSSVDSPEPQVSDLYTALNDVRELVRSADRAFGRFEEQTRTATEREVVERCAAAIEALRGIAGFNDTIERSKALAAIRALSEQKS